MISMPKHRTRIKICGLRSEDDVRFVAEAGADAIGLNFYPRSPRAVALEAALALREAFPPFVACVALFVNPEPDEVARICQRLQPDLLQFHGDESAGFCEQFHRPYLKAIRVQEGAKGDDLLQYAAQFSSARAVLLDKFEPGLFGGTGRSFDWQTIPVALRGRIILSGGLTPANVGEAIRQIRPFAVDVSSGVEKATGTNGAKGVKDHQLIADFVNQVRQADQDA